MKLLVIGASGHASVIIDMIEKNGYSIIGIIDDFKTGNFMGYEILGKTDNMSDIAKKYDVKNGVIAIGDNWTRKMMYDKIKKQFSDFVFSTIIDKTAVIGKNVEIGNGNVIMPNSVINSNTKTGIQCIINTNSSVDHDCILDDFSSIAPGSTIGGNTKIGRFSAVGIGATILHNISIGKHAVIGAGSVVNRNIKDFSVAYGVPVKTIRKREIGEKYL